MKPIVKEKGQGLLEYTLIIVLVAVIVVGLLTLLTQGQPTLTGTVIEQKSVCATDSVRVDNNNKGATCNKTRTEVLVNFGSFQSYLWTDIPTASFETNTKYLFTFDQDGQITKSFPAK